MNHVLDNCAWSSLTGNHQSLSSRCGSAIRYVPDVSIFGAVENMHARSAWSDLAELVEPGGGLALIGDELDLPDGWEYSWRGTGVQMVGTSRLAPSRDGAATLLTDDDVPDMLDLVARTQPGPFTKRTIALGAYLGIRENGRLVAMAGERMKPAGWTEISAVCTDPEFRGKGLAARLIRAVAAGIRDRGEQAFMHAVDTNPAIRLYEHLGFEVRTPVTFSSLRRRG